MLYENPNISTSNYNYIPLPIQFVISMNENQIFT